MASIVGHMKLTMTQLENAFDLIGKVAADDQYHSCRHERHAARHK
jgi:hypothetical protein